MADPPMALLARPRVKATFGPGTVPASLAEESRTAFHHSPGRLSFIFTLSEPFLDMDSTDLRRSPVGMPSASECACGSTASLSKITLNRFL
jgi:hypothetical protein